MTRLRMLAFWCAVAVGAEGCLLDLSGAPCAADDNCPAGQFCDSSGSCKNGEQPPDRLLRIELVAARRVLPAGAREQLSVQGFQRNGAKVDLTGRASWSTSNPQVAQISQAGVVAAELQGVALVRATVDAHAAELELTVTRAELLGLEVVDPIEGPLPKGRARALAAIGTFSDGSRPDVSSLVSWSSSAPQIAQVSNETGARGQVTARAMGSATIRADLGLVGGTRQVHVIAPELVRLEVSPAAVLLARGTARQLAAVGLYSDGSTAELTSLVTWSVASGAIASVSNATGSRGLLTALAAGTTEITAALGAVSVRGSATVTAATLSSISVAPAQPSLAIGTSRQLTATGIFSDGSNQDLTSQVTWASSNGTVATVSNVSSSRGLVSGHATGAADVSATLGGTAGKASVTVTDAVLTSISVTPSPVSIAVGAEQRLVATGIFSNSTTQELTESAAWTSANTAVAVVSDQPGSKGRTTAKAAGTTAVTATFSGVSGTASVQVKSAVLASLAVTPANTTLIKGTGRQYTATATYSDGTTLEVTDSVSWSSSTPSVAGVSNAAGSEGMISALAAGSTTIAVALDGVNGATPLTVTAPTLTAITVSPANSSLAKGTARPLTAVGTYSDSSTQDLTEAVTWSSSNSALANVSNASGSKGLVSGLEVGSVTISATFGGVTGSTTVNVTAAVLTGLSITPVNPTIFSYGYQQFTATGTYSDGSSQSLTNAVLWSSSNPAVATISNAEQNKGRASGGSAGTTTISATLGSTTAQTSLRVQ